MAAQDQLLQRLLLQLLAGGQAGGQQQEAPLDVGLGGRMVGGFPEGTPPPQGRPGGGLPVPPLMDAAQAPPQQDIQAILRQLGEDNKDWLAPSIGDVPTRSPTIGDVPPRRPSPFSVQGGFFPSEAPLDPNMQLPGIEPAAPSPFPAAPLPPPDSRLGAPPADEQGGYSGGRLRFPDQAPGELPAAPEKAGDLSRGRASGELEKLYAMQQMGESLGGMEVVTAGDILHRTAKGVGPGRPRGQALKSYTDFLAKKELGGLGAKDALSLQGLKGSQALEEIKARGEAATKTALASRTPKLMSPTERGEWRGAQVAISELNEILQTKIDKNYNTGPLANAFEDLAAFVGFESFGFAEKQEFKYRAARIVREYIFSLSGKQTSGQERKDLMKLVPRGRDDDILFEEKIRGFQAFVRKKQNVLLESQPEATIETENLRRMMVEEDQNDPYLHRGGKTVYQIEDPDAPGAFFDVSESTWKAIMANPGGTRYKAVPLKKP